MTSNLVSRLKLLAANLWSPKSEATVREAIAALEQLPSVETAPRRFSRPDFKQWAIDSMDGTMEPRLGGEYYKAEEVDAWIDGLSRPAVEPTPPHPGPSIEKAFANSPRRVEPAAKPNDAVRWICPVCTTVNSNNDERCCVGSCAGRRPEKASGEPDLSGLDHPRQHATMSVDTAPGSRVQYMDCNGYPGDTDHCRRAGLIKDEAYEVVEIDVYSDYSAVRLKGFDGWRFNSVCFCAAENGDERHE